MSIGSACSVAKDGYYERLSKLLPGQPWPSFSMLAGSLLLQAEPHGLALAKTAPQIIHLSKSECARCMF